MTEEQTGGTDWELRTANEQLIAAWRAGDMEGATRALIRFNQGLRNMLAGVLEPYIAPLDERVTELEHRMDERNVRE